MRIRAPLRLKRIFFGWWTVLASGIMSFWVAGVWSYSVGAYFEPLQKEFGWTRAELSAAASLRQLEGGVEGPLGGILTDKYGPRAVNLVGMFIAGLGFILMYFVNSLVSYYAFWLMVCIGFNTGYTGPLNAAISKWFVKKRGTAGSINRIILAFGGSVIPTFMTHLIISSGWRISFVMAGLITWGIGLPLTWFFVRPRRPEFYGLLPDGAPMADTEMGNNRASMIKAGQEYAAKLEEVEFTLRQAMRTLTFWIQVIARCLRSFAGPVIQIHQISYLISVGYDSVTAAEILGLQVFLSIPGRLLGGILSDRFSTRRLKYLLMLAYALQATGVFFILSATNLNMVYLFTFAYGLGQGLSVSANTPIIARFFGRKSFATIVGTMSTVALPFSVFATIYAGWVFDVTQSYISVYTQALFMLLGSIIVLLFLFPPKKRPEVISDVEKFF